jgi:hypothetical protein
MSRQDTVGGVSRNLSSEKRRWELYYLQFQRSFPLAGAISPQQQQQHACVDMLADKYTILHALRYTQRCIDPNEGEGVSK